jgi:sugar transferase (PEP-CTERM/EpsH1 system associated)
MRPPLLFLAHRLPYPPNKGDKIRSFHLLRHLANGYRVFLGAFVDTPEDAQHADALREYCEEVMVLRLRPGPAKLASLRGLLQGQPLTVPYYWRRALAVWVDRTIARVGIQRALVFSSAVAPYLMGGSHAGLRRVIDFVDVDSDKWAQYAETTGRATRWIYRREALRLLQLERRIAAEFDGSVFVSAAEAALFRKLSPESADKVSFVYNGVDRVYFDPERPLPNPYVDGHHPVVFTGAMDYWPNVDAVCWFAEQVLPTVRRAEPRAIFYVVGARPAPAVQRLARLPGVRVTGHVADVRPYLRHATAVVAPLRIARGIQNKVLEAMAMARPTVVTPAALEGIDAVPGEELLLATDAEAFADRVIAVIEGRVAPTIGSAARRRVYLDFDWDRNLSGFQRLLEGGTT